jgi:hypothetical protein
VSSGSREKVQKDQELALTYHQRDVVLEACCVEAKKEKNFWNGSSKKSACGGEAIYGSYVIKSRDFASLTCHHLERQSNPIPPIPLKTVGLILIAVLYK